MEPNHSSPFFIAMLFLQGLLYSFVKLVLSSNPLVVFYKTLLHNGFCLLTFESPFYLSFNDTLVPHKLGLIAPVELNRVILSIISVFIEVDKTLLDDGGLQRIFSLICIKTLSREVF